MPRVAPAVQTVIGIIEMTIPSRTLEKSLEKLIRAAMPKPTEAGKIGYINYIPQE
ncbi:hypothetical protein FOZ62_021682 [Perkinsus olseni]|uniref:Uncharacterized protein n=1 Tax=Perkinsus olseni TaxID=32597 RepID=A0A7J6TAI9_PEROL|nr:hypothetical protein FOZ62_021682 [Perkinsus olseni]